MGQAIQVLQQALLQLHQVHQQAVVLISRAVLPVVRRVVRAKQEVVRVLQLHQKLQADRGCVSIKWAAAMSVPRLQQTAIIARNITTI